MVSFTINFDASDAINKLKIDIPKIAKDELHKGGDLVLQDAKDAVHVISGDLKASGYVDKREHEVEVGFRKEYASIEENRAGGKYAGKHAYFQPAIDKNISEITKNMERALEEAVK